MAERAPKPAPAELYADRTPDDQREIDEVAKWVTELKLAQKEKHYKRWQAQSKRAKKRFADENADDESAESNLSRKKRYNILWSNIQTLGPAIYSRVPKPQVDRRKRNRDQVAMTAAESLERTLEYSVDSYDFDHVLVNCRDDYLLTAFAQVWVRSQTEYGPPEVDVTTGAEFRPVIYEEVVADYVHHNDFLCNPARTWDEVRWVARRVYLSKPELEKAFGVEKAKECKLDHVPDNIENDKELKTEQEEFRKAIVWEIWDKPTKKVVHISRGCAKFLKKVDDPLHLKKFFPCPRPLTGVKTSESIWPIPDFVQYADQAAELDEVTQRIALLVSALAVKGVYDGSKEEIKRLLEECDENELIAVTDWASLAQSGGIKGVVDFMPLGEIVQTINGLRQEKAEIIQEIYELTGISDIVRGNSSPSETATAQQIKGKFATLRLSDRQGAMQRFARDIIAIKGEIIAEHFHPETFAEVLGVDLQDPAMSQSFMPALALLKDEKLRSFRVTIETDSTISVNEEIEKQAGQEFLAAAGPFVQQASQTIAVDPIWGPVMGGMLMFIVRKYKAGRALENTIQSAVDQATQAAIDAQAAQAEQAQQPPPPDPKMIEANAKMELAQQKFALEQQKAAEKSSLEQQKFNLEAQLKAMEQQLKDLQARHEIAIERERLNGNLTLQEEKIRADMALKAYERPDQNNLDTIASLKAEPVVTPAAPPITVIIHNKQTPKPVIARIAKGADGSMIPIYKPESEESAASEIGEPDDGD